MFARCLMEYSLVECEQRNTFQIPCIVQCSGCAGTDYIRSLCSREPGKIDSNQMETGDVDILVCFGMGTIRFYAGNK